MRELLHRVLPPFSSDEDLELGLLATLALVAKSASSVAEQCLSLALAVPSSFVF